jgi:hypothetical protein
MTQHLRLLIGAIIITIFAAPAQAKSFQKAKKIYASAEDLDRQAFAWLKVAGYLDKGEAVYKQYANTFSVAQ